MAVAMKKTGNVDMITPHWHQKSAEIQKFGEVVKDSPIGLEEKVRAASCKMLNQVLADSMALRDMYKKHHWQTAGPTFNQLHLLFDKHYDEQVLLVDAIAERIQILGGVTVAMGSDVAEMTKVPHPPKGKEEVPAQLSRLIEAHKIVIADAHEIGKKADDSGDDGTNDLAISQVLRTNELQSWFLMQHLVEMPLVEVR
ncbi:MAG: DNA starvation/stationary phase protection protein [Acidobacteria bacterium]|nr:DNA starvation/stationary phase protection protein [Acidobacteriota bacterium]